MLGLAAGSLGLGPGDTPRDGFLDADYLEHHGGLVGESLFWASAKLFSTAGSHILFVFLLLAGVLLLTGASIASILTATREAADDHRARAPHDRATARVPYQPLPPIVPPEPEDREPVVRATHVEVPAHDTDEFASTSSRGRRQPSGDYEAPEDSTSRSRLGGRGGAPRSRAHPDGQPALARHRVRRHRLPACRSSPS